jgi:hypothetical protein
MRADTSLIVPGRPGRRDMNVYFCAINRRCQRRIVSGVTMVATCLSTWRPSRWPLIQTYPTAAQLFMENSVLLHQIFDYLLLVAVDPSGQGHKQQA